VIGGQKYASGTDGIADLNLCQIFKYSDAILSGVAETGKDMHFNCDGSNCSWSHFRVLTLSELNAMSYMRHRLSWPQEFMFTVMDNLMCCKSCHIVDFI
jgi:hypothetical protein